MPNSPGQIVGEKVSEVARHECFPDRRGVRYDATTRPPDSIATCDCGQVWLLTWTSPDSRRKSTRTWYPKREKISRPKAERIAKKWRQA